MCPDSHTPQIYRWQPTRLAQSLLRAMFDVGYFPPNTPPVLRTAKAKMCDGGHFAPPPPLVTFNQDVDGGGRHDCSCEKDRHAARSMV